MRYGILAALACLGLLALTSASTDDKEEQLPVGTTSQPPTLEYYSARTSQMRLYRVRCTPDTLKTEINWMDGEEVLAGGRIAKCPKGMKDCDWARFGTTDGKTAKKTTMFGYGVNGDQFKDKPEAFCHDGKCEAADDYPTLTTAIHGTFADKDDQDVRIDITVTSEVTEEELGYIFQTKDKDKDKDGAPLMLSTGDGSPGTFRKPVLVWESAGSPAFNDAVRKSGAELVKEKTRYEVRRPKDIVVSRKLLKVMIGDDVIAETTAPAYRPKD